MNEKKDIPENTSCPNSEDVETPSLEESLRAAAESGKQTLSSAKGILPALYCLLLADAQLARGAACRVVIWASIAVFIGLSFLINVFACLLVSTLFLLPDLRAFFVLLFSVAGVVAFALWRMRSNITFLAFEASRRQIHKLFLTLYRSKATSKSHQTPAKEHVE